MPARQNKGWQGDPDPARYRASSNSIQRHLTGWQASRFANLILAGANGLVTTDPGHRLSVSVYRQGITLWFLDGYERYISLTYSEACVLADWLIRMANKQYMEVA